MSVNYVYQPMLVCYNCKAEGKLPDENENVCFFMDKCRFQTSLCTECIKKMAPVDCRGCGETITTGFTVPEEKVMGRIENFDRRRARLKKQKFECSYCGIQSTLMVRHTADSCGKEMLLCFSCAGNDECACLVCREPFRGDWEIVVPDVDTKSTEAKKKADRSSRKRKPTKAFDPSPNEPARRVRQRVSARVMPDDDDDNNEKPSEMRSSEKEPVVVAAAATATAAEIERAADGEPSDKTVSGGVTAEPAVEPVPEPAVESIVSEPASEPAVESIVSEPASEPAVESIVSEPASEPVPEIASETFLKPFISEPTTSRGSTFLGGVESFYMPPDDENADAAMRSFMSRRAMSSLGAFSLWEEPAVSSSKKEPSLLGMLDDSESAPKKKKERVSRKKPTLAALKHRLYQAIDQVSKLSARVQEMEDELIAQ